MSLRALMAAVESFNDQFPEDESADPFAAAPSREEWEAHKAAMTPAQRAFHALDSAGVDASPKQQQQDKNSAAA